jgi:hypothetical protein
VPLPFFPFSATGTGFGLITEKTTYVCYEITVTEINQNIDIEIQQR